MSDDVRTVHGKGVNAIMRAVKAVGGAVAPLAPECTAMDDGRVNAILITSRRGDNVFGDVAPHRGVPVKGWVDLPDEEMRVAAYEDVVTFEGTKVIHTVGLTDNLPRFRTPSLGLMPSFDVRASELRQAVKTVKAVGSDYVTFGSTGGRMYLGTVRGETEILYSLAPCSDNVHAVYPMNRIKALADVAVGDVEISMDNDHPMRWRWFDDYNVYEYYLAPRIEPSGGE